MPEIKNIQVSSKIKKRCLIFLACISIFFNTAVFGADAATNTQWQELSLFSDVDVSAPYYDDLKFLIDLDIINGFADGLFYPNRAVSRAEFIKMLVIAADYEITQEPANIFIDVDSHWSAPYINTAAANKIININQDSHGTRFYPDEPVTRQEMAVFLVNALNIHSYSAPTLYSDTDNIYINLASSEYLLLGISKNGKNLFKPQEYLIRADVCRIIANAIQYRKDAEVFKNKMILEFSKNNIITTELQLYDLLRACTMNFVYQIILKIDLTLDKVESAVNTYMALNPEKPFISSVAYETEGAPRHISRITFNYDLSRSEEERRIKELDRIADEFVKNYIRADMTVAEKITEIHKYIILNGEYDTRYYNLDSNELVWDKSEIDIFTAYGALINNKAVCQGFSAAFNLLAKKSGIASVAVIGTPPNSTIEHMWNMVCIDGKIYFIDTTWDNPIPKREGYYGTKYLLKTEQEFKDFGYKWDNDLIRKEYLNK